MPTRWEDQERGNWDIEAMRKEFRQRLYVNPPAEDNSEIMEAIERLLKCRTAGFQAAYGDDFSDPEHRHKADRSMVLNYFLDSLE